MTDQEAFERNQERLRLQHQEQDEKDKRVIELQAENERLRKQVDTLLATLQRIVG